MPKPGWHAFARALRDARESAGFSSARAFYLQCGGRKFFGAGYRQYLNVESGLCGPGAALLDKVLLALQLSSDAPRCRRLLRHYLACLVASESLMTVILQALSGSGEEAAAAVPLQKALARQSEARATLLSREQADCIDASLGTFWLWNIIINDSEPRAPEDLARMTGLPSAEVSQALKSLHARGLAAKDRDGRWYCGQQRRVFRFPRDEHYVLGRQRHHRYLDRIAAKGGCRLLLRHYSIFRGSEHEMLAYGPNLRAAVEGANVCEVAEKGPDTGLMVVEVSARKIFPY